jgi:hypothetical protein
VEIEKVAQRRALAPRNYEVSDVIELIGTPQFDRLCTRFRQRTKMRLDRTL